MRYAWPAVLRFRAENAAHRARGLELTERSSMGDAQSVVLSTKTAFLFWSSERPLVTAPEGWRRTPHLTSLSDGSPPLSMGSVDYRLGPIVDQLSPWSPSCSPASSLLAVSHSLPVHLPILLAARGQPPGTGVQLH